MNDKERSGIWLEWVDKCCAECVSEQSAGSMRLRDESRTNGSYTASSSFTPLRTPTQTPPPIHRDTHRDTNGRCFIPARSAPPHKPAAALWLKRRKAFIHSTGLLFFDLVFFVFWGFFSPRPWYDGNENAIHFHIINTNHSFTWNDLIDGVFFAVPLERSVNEWVLQRNAYLELLHSDQIVPERLLSIWD